MRHIPSSGLLEPNILEGKPLESQGLLCLCVEYVRPWHWHDFPLLRPLVSFALRHFLLAHLFLRSGNAVFLLDAYGENAREEGGNHQVDSCSAQQAS